MEESLSSLRMKIIVNVVVSVQNGYVYKYRVKCFLSYRYHASSAVEENGFIK